MTEFIVVFLSQTNAEIAALLDHEIPFQIISPTLSYASLDIAPYRTIYVVYIYIYIYIYVLLKEEKTRKLFMFHGGKICVLAF
jgi:hypothetical protein